MPGFFYSFFPAVQRPHRAGHVRFLLSQMEICILNLGQIFRERDILIESQLFDIDTAMIVPESLKDFLIEFYQTFPDGYSHYTCKCDSTSENEREDIHD